MQTLTKFELDGEELPAKIDELEWQSTGKSYTVSGYGIKIPTPYKVLHKNRWKRVYCRIFSNIGSLYIMCRSRKIFITEV